MLLRQGNISTRIAIAAVLSISALSPAFVQAQPGFPDPPPPYPPAIKVEANLLQLMRGTLYPESNVVFAAQDTNPADVPHAKDPSMSTDLLTSQYGKWDAVENSALAMAEVSNLLMLPGRKCANGLDVPVKNADWSKYVEELRAAGMSAYAAAQTKNQQKMTEVSDVLTEACKNCHDRYRDRRSVANRCK